MACEAPDPFLQRIFLEKLNPAWDGHTTGELEKAPAHGPEVPHVDDQAYVTRVGG